MLGGFVLSSIRLEGSLFEHLRAFGRVRLSRSCQRIHSRCFAHNAQEGTNPGPMDRFLENGNTVILMIPSHPVTN